MNTPPPRPRNTSGNDVAEAIIYLAKIIAWVSEIEDGTAAPKDIK